MMTHPPPDAQQFIRLTTINRERVLFALGFVCLLTALLYTGFDTFFLFSLCLATFLGYLLGFVLLQNSHFCFCLQIILAQFFGLIPPTSEHHSSDLQNDDEAKPESKRSQGNGMTNYVPPPWERIRLDKRLNRELEELFETLMECYVHNWYTESVSHDSSFLLEIRHLIRHSSANLINSLNSVDLYALFVDDLFPLVLAHVERICRLTNETILDPELTAHHQNLPPSFVEYKLLEQWSDDLHWALRSPQNHNTYLRAVADLLVRHLVDDIRIGGCFVDEEHAQILGKGGKIPSATKWSCHGSRHFLRELLFSTVLVPSLDFVSDPDSLNRLALNMLNDNPSMVISSPEEEGAEEEREGPESATRERAGTSPPEQTMGVFLAKFAEPCYTHTPDSLLGLKLNDLVENPYLTKLFEMYLRDLNGPTHLLDCFVQARDIHMRTQALKNQNPTKADVDEANEICFDAWQLFSTFVHSNGPNRIAAFGQRIEREFSEALESNKSGGDGQANFAPQGNVGSLKALERVIEQIYQQVHQQLQYNYVIPFCQSENYLGYLCGAPPDVDELIRGPTEERWTSRREAQKMPEGTFSLTQFRKKLFNFITPTKDSSSSASTSVLDELGTSADDAPLSELDPANIAMIDLGRDMNKWTVTIEGVEQRRSQNPASWYYYIFSLMVERNDLPDECYVQPPPKPEKKPKLTEEEEDDECFEDEDAEDESLPKIWTVGHRYEEFYALEDRLREQYGNTLRMAALPDRKSTLQLLQIGRNNRALMETHKLHFERFLQQLLQQPNLKRSDCLYAFLTSEENSTGLFGLGGSSQQNVGNSFMANSAAAANFLTDLNPIRAMRGKGKERGQNLKPFILNMLANTLAPPIRQPVGMGMPMANSRTSVLQRQNSTSLDGGSLKSETAAAAKSGPRSARSDGPSGRSNKNFFPSAPASISFASMEATNSPNPANDQQPDDQPPNDDIGWKNNWYDVLLFLVAHLGVVARLPVWLESLLCSLRSLVSFLCSLWFARRVRRALDDTVLNVEMAIYLVHTFHELVLFWNVPGSSSLSATPSQLSMSSSAQQQPTEAKLIRAQRRQQQFINNSRQTAATGATATHQPTPAVSEQERKLRADLVLHCLEKRVGDSLLFFPACSPLIRWILDRITILCPKNGPDSDPAQLESPIRLLFLCFQMPTLNRQLALVLFDRVLQRVVMEQRPREDEERDRGE